MAPRIEFTRLARRLRLQVGSRLVQVDVRTAMSVASAFALLVKVHRGGGRLGVMQQLLRVSFHG